MTALIGSVVWASLAGVAIALLVAGVVAAIVRLQRPAAATRYALWFVALAMCAAAPVAIVGAMVVRGADHVAVAALPESSSVDEPAAAADARDASATGAAGPARAGGSAHAALHVLAGATQSLRRPPALTRRVALGIVAVWAIGALVGLIGLGRSLLRVHALKRRSSPLDGALADDLPWLTETAGREIYLRLSYEIETPIAVGFRRPVILIPTDMATLDGLRAIESLVMHEYAHLTHYDDWSNLVQRLIERIVWFNPLVWIVGRRIALEREVAADDAVVARTNDAKQYASTLWRMAREMRMPEHVVVAPGAMFTRKQISIRIERLLDEGRARRPHVGMAVVAVAIGACTVAAVAATAPPLVLAASSPLESTAANDAPAVAEAMPAPAPVANADPQPAASPAPQPCPAPASIAAPRAPATPLLGIAHARQSAVTAGQAAIAASQRAMAAAKRALDDAKKAARFTPHAAPPGTVTREMVAACHNCDFSNRDLSNLDFSHLTIIGANFDGANLSHTDFTGAMLLNVSYRGADLSEADFSNAKIIASRFDGAIFQGADFSNARFFGSKIDIGALAANGVMHSMLSACAGCDFQNADLHGQDLHGARLEGSNLQSADLHGANLRGARLTGANLSDVNLDHADLTGANLEGANLNGASMDGAVTTNADLTGATLPQ